MRTANLTPAHVTSAALEAFARSWPGCGLSAIGAASFEFDGDGNLVDYTLSDHVGRYTEAPSTAGAAMVALADLAWRRYTPIRSRAAIRDRLQSKAARKRADAILAPVYATATQQPDKASLYAFDSDTPDGFRFVRAVMPDRPMTEQRKPGEYGWHTDPQGDVFKDGTGLLWGVVYALPAKDGKRRLVAGYQTGGTSWGPLLDLGTVYTAENDEETGREAPFAADAMAQHAAEEEREYNEAWQAGSRHAEVKERISEARKALLSRLVEFRRLRALVAPRQFPNLCASARDWAREDLELIGTMKREASALFEKYRRPLGFPSHRWAGERLWNAFCDGAGLKA